MLAAAKSVAKMASSDFENEDLRMIWRDSRRGNCAGEVPDET
jgi:hypothetical protein